MLKNYPQRLKYILLWIYGEHSYLQTSEKTNYFGLEIVVFKETMKLQTIIVLPSCSVIL